MAQNNGAKKSCKEMAQNNGAKKWCKEDAFGIRACVGA